VRPFSETALGKRGALTRAAGDNALSECEDWSCSLAMASIDDLTHELSGLLEGHYDCMDRITLNGFFRMGSTSGGLLKWWNALTGGEPLTEDKLRAFAGTFSRRVRAWAKQQGVPLIDFAIGDTTKHEQAEKLQPKDPAFAGVFAVFVARAPALTWDAYINPKGKVVLYRPKRGALVNHYYFHIVDPQWGHVTIRLCGHPPFPALIMLNAHEWVERTAAREGVRFAKRSNCFVEGSDLRGVDKIATRLLAPGAILGLAEVCERWIYSACLCFGLTREEQRRSGFAYQFSVYQIEYSRNFVFHSGRRLDEYYQSLVERIWPVLDVPRLKTIFGRCKRPHRKPGRAVERRLERTDHDLTVFKLKFARLELKMYDKGARVLRVEMIARHIDDLRCGRQLARVPEMLRQMRQTLFNFLDVVQAVHQPALSSRHLDALATPSRRGEKRIAGVDLQKPRMQAVAAGVIALAANPRGFTAEELAAQTKRHRPRLRRKYGVRQAAYDLRKLRAKTLVQRIGQTRRYRVRKSALRTLAGWFVLREKIIKPVLEGVCRPRRGRPRKLLTPTSCLEQHYRTLQQQLHETLDYLKLAA
jgi:hypothetical protein